MEARAHRARGGARGSQPGIEERRERQRNEARRAILDATEALMIEKNGSDFSIRGLGQRSGYSAPTVYHYFGDKDGLIDALLEERLARLADQLESVAPTGDARRDLRSVLLAYVEFGAEHPTFTRLMWTVSSKGETRTPPALDRIRRRIREAVERFGETGELGRFDPEGAGRILWALAYGLVSLRLTQPEFGSDESLTERAIDAFFVGMPQVGGGGR